MKNKVILSVIFLVMILVIGIVSAPFGYDNPNLPKIIREPPVVITFDNNTGSVNSSNFWDGLNTFNTTQMENNDGVLNILESWLTTLWNTIFATKTTDDLTEGSINLYDNRSWNQTFADTLYADISVVSNPFDQSLNTTDNVIFSSVNATGDIFSNNFQVISYQRTVNIKNVTMTAVI